MELGNISEPKLVYLDGEQVKWIVTAGDVRIDNSVEFPTKGHTPVLRKGKEGDKKVG